MKEFFKSWVQKRQLIENFRSLFWALVALSWVLITDSHGSLSQSPIFKSHQTPADLFFSSPSRLSSMAFLQNSLCQLSLSTLYHKPLRSVKTRVLQLLHIHCGSHIREFVPSPPLHVSLFRICCNDPSPVWGVWIRLLCSSPHIH